MRSSSKQLALTSVAYAVTLLAIGLMATVQLKTAAAAEAAVATQVQAQANLKTMNTIEAKRLERIQQASRAQAVALKASKAEYKASQRLTGKELSQILSHVGFQGEAHKIAWAIVMRESSGRPMAHNGNSGTGDNSYGLFQINMIGDLGADRREKFDLRSNADLFDPVRNAEVAYHMSNGGADFGSWGIGPNAYRSGAGINTISKWFDEYAANK